MKAYYKYILVAGIAIFGLVVSCRQSFLDTQPYGSTSVNTLANKAGVEGLLIGAYSMLDGIGGPSDFDGTPFSQGISNWVFGGIASDDAHKGSTDDDQSSAGDIEKYAVNSANPYLSAKWVSIYTGIQRANDVIRVMARVTDGSITKEEETGLKAEALFLRAVYHLEAAKLWRNVPYVSDSVSYENNNFYVPNTDPVWPRIEEDFLFAIANLPAVQPQVGRANTWGAKAFLAKTYMFEHKFAEAKNLLDDIIQNGVTSSGQSYALVNYPDNFDPSKKNNSESLFAVQMSVHDGSSGANNGNIGDVLNFPYGGPTTCCGFYQPSFSLANSYKTDATTGLPLLDTWNDFDIKNDQNIGSDVSFTPYEGTLDPRLDYVVGRRGIPYLDWGIMPGQAWVRAQAQGGPYIPRKFIVSKAQSSTANDVAGGWGVNQASSVNYVMIRYADVLLWAAEAEIEVGSLDKAEAYVNMVRDRAARPGSWMHTYVDNNDPSKGFTNTPAANYFIRLYPAGMFASQGQEYARKAVRFERKLEFGMEGHRFFDLQRYDNGTGYMADVLNAYIQHETHIEGFNFELLKGAVFTKGKNEIYPIPLDQIDLSVHGGAPTLTQNPGY
ncbi:MAG TPA: RagB/SusD family nutrient uptake outer membrane protein [Parafilimonas sp.]|nr:RagB/SusD family nutrient uptake outer membrane protein [Parafilimonas sp.]